MASLLPSDRIRHFATDAGLLTQYHAAAIAPQPLHRHRNQFCMGETHRLGLLKMRASQQSLLGGCSSEK
jgi:hypothetical protein